ncbi:hypothetical protein E2320_021658, partial [Naja naja]
FTLFVCLFVCRLRPLISTQLAKKLATEEAVFPSTQTETEKVEKSGTVLVETGPVSYNHEEEVEEEEIEEEEDHYYGCDMEDDDGY